jgi:potassium channel subfamily K
MAVCGIHSATIQKHCVKSKWYIIGMIAIAWFGLGIWVGCSLEGWRPITAVYVMVQIITTIGYGDITFATQSMKLFTALYIFVGLLIVAGLVSGMVTSILEKQEQLVRSQLKNLESKVDEKEKNRSTFAKIGDTVKAFNKLIAATIAFGVFVAAGTVFYRLYENCTCSYGRTKIDTCVEGHLCPETGGSMKSWIDAFYMSVITLTTVGFGDYSPQSYYGRWFGVFWMLFGVAATGNFISVFSEFFLTAKQERSMQLQAISKDVFDSIPKKTSGRLSKMEFRCYAVEQLQLVKKEDVEDIDDIFDKIDTNKDDALSPEEIKEYFDADAAGKEA